MLACFSDNEKRQLLNLSGYVPYGTTKTVILDPERTLGDILFVKFDAHFV